MFAVIEILTNQIQVITNKFLFIASESCLINMGVIVKIGIYWIFLFIQFSFFL